MMGARRCSRDLAASASSLRFYGNRGGVVVVVVDKVNSGGGIEDGGTRSGVTISFSH